MKNWVILDKKSEDVIEQILLARGINKNEIGVFLNPDFSKNLLSPNQMLNMKKAVERISQAVKNNDKVAIFGDYDADGIPGSVLAFEALKKIGLSTQVYISNRNDGYGLNVRIIKELIKKGFDLLICVDNGTKNISEINKFYKKIDFIICDHHEVGKQIPKAILLNPKQKKCNYSFKELSGCGVTFKLVQALQKKYPTKIFENDLKWWTELVSISTICDVVPLVGENRIFAKFGLIALKKTKRIGLKKLFEYAKINQKEISSYSVGFQIGPRLNAPARMEMSNESFALLSENDEKKAHELAGILEKANQKRQYVLQKTLDEVKKIIKKSKIYKNKLILIAGKNWPSGVVGLVAGKIVEKYARPAIVLSTDGKTCKGSARSVDGFHIIEVLEKNEKYLTKFGGHSKAAGLSLKYEHIDILYSQLLEMADNSLHEEDLVPKITIDLEIDHNKINLGLVKDLIKLEPFGLGNPRPVFVCKNMSVVSKKMLGQKQNHLKMLLAKENKTFSAIGFDMKKCAKSIDVSDKIDLVFYLDINSWNGRETVDLKILDLKKSNN